jgi:Protein of unknown function (DUF2975)
MNTLVIWLLRVILVVLLLGSVLVQVAVPIHASNVGETIPEVAQFVVPYSVAAILFIGCGQVALLAIWRLLSFVKSGVIFTRRALRWVDVIIACASIATLLTAGVLLQMLFFFIPGGQGPAILWLAAVAAAGVMFVLLMLVMRGLLEAATADRSELDAVI